MYAIVAARGTFELLSLPGGVYAVREGDYGRLFKEGRCANDNWYEAYNFLLNLYEKHKKGTGHGKGKGIKLPKLDSRVLYHLASSPDTGKGGKGPTPSHGAEQHQRLEVPQGTLV